MSTSISRALGALAALFCAASIHAQAPVAGPNVNMVSGTRWPQGDPFLTKQNEPSIAVSSRNPRHLLAGSNDYRLVPVAIAEELDDPEAWIQVYKSVDGGESWYSTPLGGCPLTTPECTDLNARGQPVTGLYTQLRGLKPNFGADPTARPGPYGTFFLSFIAGTRDTGANGVVAVQRFVDKNNDVQRGTDVRGVDGAGNPFVRPAQDPILPDTMNIITVGTPGQSKDKPWVAADIGGRSWNAGKSCELLSWTKGKPGVVADVHESIKAGSAFSVYVSFANFTGTNSKPDIYVAASNDCGTTFAKPVKLTSGSAASQGTTSAIDPLTGAVYVAWRSFFVPGTTNVDAVMISKSTDGGATWSKKPIQVAAINPYDQGSTSVSMRTLGFPAVAVSVGADGKSRVHVVWTQRKVRPNTAPPYACPGVHADDCDARVVMSTSLDGGNTWPAPTAVDTPPAGNDPFNPTVGRGHQIQPAITFAAGKLLVTWLDQRLDSTEGALQCPDGGTDCAVKDMHEVRLPRGNLDPACTFPATVAQVGGTSCYLKDTVFSPYISDGTKYLVRRHTLDVFAASATPANVPVFTSNRVSQYAFGSSLRAHPDPNNPGKFVAEPGSYQIRQKEVNPVNLPLFANGTGAFLGDYIDAAGPLIVATDGTVPYKFNVGGGGTGTPFTVTDRASTFHITFTDNRDVIPPYDGNWVTPTCNTSTFAKDTSGNDIVGNANSCNGTGKPGPGFSGNRNQNVYSAVVSDHSVAFANFNSKLLGSTPRGFVVTIQNLSNIQRTYTLDLRSQPSGAIATFDKVALKTTDVIVQPGSSTTRTVWATGTPKAQVAVKVTTSSDASWTTQVLLNPDPNGVFVTNGDGTTPDKDTANDDLGNVVLSNAVLSNNALSNNALSNAVLSNNALTNAVLSNVVLSNGGLANLAPGGSTDPNVALSNNVLSNVVLSNVVLSNTSIGNVALSNNVLSNVVLTNNALNVALSNLDPTNVALSNVVLSNNALTNVVLSNLDPNAALSNAVLSNAVLSNVALSNVVLSNNALSNNVLSNNVLSNVVLSNAGIPEQQANAQSANDPDADPLRPIEKGSPELAFNNPFTLAELQSSSQSGLGFKETTFTVRNRGNTDTTLSVKMLLRDAICTGAPAFTCTTPPTFDLQVFLRKVAFNPAAIPPTGPATASGQDIRIGLSQRNAEISNVGTLALIDPTDPTFGQFQPLDPNAATLPLAAGEFAYVTVRAIGKNGNTPPDPADLLQWGVKAISSNATTTTGPLVITTLGFPSTPRLFVALQAAAPTVSTFGGTGTVTGAVQCTDKDGNAVLTGGGNPGTGVGAVGNWYINTTTRTVFGPKTQDPVTPWAASRAQLQATTDLLNPVQAFLPCPLPPTDVAIGGFTTTHGANSVDLASSATLSFKPTYWGDFYTRLSAFDGTSATVSQDEGVIKVHVDAAIPNLVFNPPATAVYNQTGTLSAIDLATGTTSDSPVAITYTATGSCSLAADNHTLVINRASVFSPAPVADCLVTANQIGNETYQNKTVSKAIFVDRAQQATTVDTVPADLALVYLTGGLPSSVTAHVTSTTAPASTLAVTFSSTTPGICTVDVNSGALTIVNAGPCTIAFDQGGNGNYYAAPQVTRTFLIDRAAQTIGFSALPIDHQITFQTGGAPTTLVAVTTSVNAPASGIAVTFASATPLVCTTSGTNGSVVTIVAAGTCIINANAVGGSNYKPATQVSPSFIVDMANQVITFGTAPSGVTFGDAPVTVSASSASPTAPPSGIAITFSSQSSGICTNVGSTVTIVAAGTCVIAADQAGNANYNAAPQVTQSFAIAKAPTQITAAALQQFTAFGAAGTTFSGNLNRVGVPAVFPVDTVSIDVQKGGTSVKTFAPITGAPNGAFSATDAATLPADSYAVIFSYGGNVNFTSATPVTAALRVEGFAPTGSMAVPRVGHSATLLADGNVLVAGGTIDATTVTPTAEIYCAVVSTQCLAAEIGKFKATGSLGTARYGHSATRLPDGNVLIAGGAIDTSTTPTGAAEIYCASQVMPLCPNTSDVGTFKPVPTGMTTPRVAHTATALNDGTVLLTGGFIDAAGTPTSTVEFYCSGTGPYCTLADAGTFKLAPVTMASPRDSHTATLLNDGTVLLAGGDTDGGFTTSAAAEIYCAAQGGPCGPTDVGAFKPVTNLMSNPRSIHAASLLTDGRVLLEGGDDSSAMPTATADVYCPFQVGNCLAADANTFKPVGGLTTARTFHASTLLHDGRSLIFGGRGIGSPGTPLASSESFGPAVNAFSLGASMGNARSQPAVVLLGDGRVLVTGGAQTGGPTSTAEIYIGPY